MGEVKVTPMIPPIIEQATMGMNVFILLMFFMRVSVDLKWVGKGRYLLLVFPLHKNAKLD
jgi:hypothetical protein